MTDKGRVDATISGFQTSEQPHRLSAHIEGRKLEPGLYLVATPIGTARDITLRALDVLNSADMLAAEDTRVMRHLLDIHGVPLRGRRILSHHDHNAERSQPALMAALRDGASVAFASDAGTPLVSDPGFRLAREAAEADIRIHAIPGPSAPLVALTVSGLPSDRFLFAGFPPAAKGQRKAWLKKWTDVDATVILFESPRRVNQTLEELCEIDPGRLTVVARELTKKFEEVIRGTAQELLDDPRIDRLKGEVVLLLDRPAPRQVDEDAIRGALRERLTHLKVRDAAREVAEEMGLPRRDVYQIALGMGE